jgi:diguanylate cyclase (GGDEF)-like protein
VVSKQGPGKPLSLILIDIDDFKGINDQRGHSAGDRVLSFVAGKLTETMRSSDSIYRYGGDEFVVCAKDSHTGRHRPSPNVCDNASKRHRRKDP